MEEAVRIGDLSRVQELIQGGADVNACRKGVPLLSLAIKVGHNDVALELIQHGANVHAKDADWGRTALHWACNDLDREVVVQRLVEEGCSVNEEDSMHFTPLSLTTEWCGVLAANHLLRAGAECKSLSKRQMNVLFLPACRTGDLFVAKTLIANGCDINARNQAGEPAIVLAAENEFDEVVKALILAGAQLDLQDENGYTALHHAALNDHIQCGVLLTEGGASMAVKDKHSRTALKVSHSEEFTQAIKQALSFTVSKNVCILGDSGVGKSTLIAALQAERNSCICRIWNRLVKRISDNRKRTAGIEAISFHSQRYGEALFFDFAGQHEYYGPHHPFLESFLNKPGVSMTVLMVVKVTDGEEAILDQLHFWLFPLVQMATTAAIPPQVIIIGSFLHQVKSSEDAAETKMQRCIEATRKHLKGIMELKFVGSCLLNCRQPQSKGIDQLCRLLREVPIPKLKAIHTPYSLAWVLSQIRLAFTTHLAVQVRTLAQWIEENRDNLPRAIPSPEEVCKDLSAAGHAFYLPNKDHCSNGWLVLDLAGILHDFYGTLFSLPKETMNRFGLLHCRELAGLFPQMHLEMVQQLLISLEFCTPVDLTVLSEDVKKLITSEEDSGWLFFPAFVSADPPKAASEGRRQNHSQHNACSLQWLLRTCEKDFFFARVVQNILLHVTANFVVKHNLADGQPHCCTFWQNGIAWQSNEGIDVTIHITRKELHVVGASEGPADRRCRYLVEVIAIILSTVYQVSPSLKADAYVVCGPVKKSAQCEFVTPPPEELAMFLVADIKRCIITDYKNDCNFLTIRQRNDHSSRVLVSDLFGGHTPTLEDVGRILWTQHGPM